MTFCDGAAPLDHAVVHHRQVVLEQDEVGGLLGDVGGAVDRDADVGGVQRRGVVDAVAEEADDAAGALQGQQDALLLLRRDPAEQLTVGEPGAQRLLAHAAQLVPGEHAGDRQCRARRRRAASPARCRRSGS